MQLVSNDSNREDISESEPILRQAGILQSSVESPSSSSSSCEITAVGGNCSVVNDDFQDLHIDESCHLVNTDQPQCRICFDSGGLYYLLFLLSFFFFFGILSINATI
jgi:hypothetical protein